MKNKITRKRWAEESLPDQIAALLRNSIGKVFLQPVLGVYDSPEGYLEISSHRSNPPTLYGKGIGVCVGVGVGLPPTLEKMSQGIFVLLLASLLLHALGDGGGEATISTLTRRQPGSERVPVGVLDLLLLGNQPTMDPGHSRTDQALDARIPLPPTPRGGLGSSRGCCPPLPLGRFGVPNPDLHVETTDKLVVAHIAPRERKVAALGVVPVENDRVTTARLEYLDSVIAKGFVHLTTLANITHLHIKTFSRKQPL